MAKINVITRKIQINVDLPKDSEMRAEAFESLNAWQRITIQASNLVSTHNFMKDKLKDLIYLSEGAKVKLADIEKDEEGILNTSNQNSTYRILSKEFKNKIPTAVLTCINTLVSSTYNAEKLDYFKGTRSLRNYKRNIPIPFPKTHVKGLTWNQGEHAFTFTLFKIPFKTYLGMDKSNNKSIINKILSGEYEMGDSSIQMKDKKIFLLLTVKFEKLEVKLDPKKEIFAQLDFDTPIIVKYKKKEFYIGNKYEFLHRRLQIQEAIHRIQKAARYNQGGRGRYKKTASLDHFHKVEVNYMNSRMHLYARRLIDQALNLKAGVIHLMNIEEVKEETKENPFLLRNWGYYGLVDKIKYKANIYGIKVVED